MLYNRRIDDYFAVGTSHMDHVITIILNSYDDSLDLHGERHTIRNEGFEILQSTLLFAA
jgi:cAMP phosphodiesterase